MGLVGSFAVVPVAAFYLTDCVVSAGLTGLAVFVFGFAALWFPLLIGVLCLLPGRVREWFRFAKHQRAEHKSRQAEYQTAR